MEFLHDITHWHWLMFGTSLIAIEILIPSAVFLWPGVAAIIIGVLSFLEPTIPSMAYVFIWAVMSVVLAFGWQIYRKRNPAPPPIFSMNKRGREYIGKNYTLMHDIVNGTGELNVDDTRWKVISNNDIVAGTRIKVTGVEGTSLRVETLID